jgi:hypothetical protein
MDNKAQVLHGGLFRDLPWATAQIIVALTGRSQQSLLEKETAAAYFNAEMNASSSAWSRYRGPNYPPHLGVTAWVLLSLAQLGQPATAGQLEFLLLSQKRDGWWPLYPSDDTDWNASTYATALATWALHEQLRKPGFRDGGQRIESAVARGTGWLYAQRVAGAARWMDYPGGREMLALSGLALHVLHLTNRYDMTDVDRLWLKSLPGTVPRAEYFEVSARTIFRGPWRDGAVGTDDVRHYPLSWAIAATIDAYGSGSLVERAFALSWFERVLATAPLEQLKGDSGDEWIAAELLIALSQLGA